MTTKDTGQKPQNRTVITQDRASGAQVMTVTAITAVLFFFGTTILGRFEIPTDIDFKPFFIPLVLVALLPVGRTTWGIALGTAIGEAIGDLLEGYEPDDLFGFFSYILAIAAAGYIIGNRALPWIRLVIGALVAAIINGYAEASAFLLLGDEGWSVFWQSSTGNIITHGIIMGAIPLCILAWLLHGRIERSLGYEPLPR